MSSKCQRCTLPIEGPRCGYGPSIERDPSSTASAPAWFRRIGQYWTSVVAVTSFAGPLMAPRRGATCHYETPRLLLWIRPAPQLVPRQAAPPSRTAAVGREEVQVHPVPIRREDKMRDEEAQQAAHGREALPVPLLPLCLEKTGNPGRPREAAHGRETVQVPLVLLCCEEEPSPCLSFEYSQIVKAVSVSSVVISKGVCVNGSRLVRFPVRTTRSVPRGALSCPPISDNRSQRNSAFGVQHVPGTAVPKRLILHRCRFCPYASKQRPNVVAHERTHTGERPFRCQYCSYAAAQKDTLKAHERRHTGERPFKCPLCPYAGKKKHHLTNHVKTHRNGSSIDRIP